MSFFKFNPCFVLVDAPACAAAQMQQKAASVKALLLSKYKVSEVAVQFLSDELQTMSDLYLDILQVSICVHLPFLYFLVP